MRAILTYHSIDSSGSVISTDASILEEQLRWLADSRVRVLPLGELLASDGADAVAITFDDGFANLAESALPLLRRHGFPATLFIVSDRVGRTNDWGLSRGPSVPVLPLLTWEDLGRAADAGFDIGAHGRAHRSLVALSVKQRMDELAGCAEEIRRNTGTVARWFAYPYGDWSQEVLPQVAATYDIACTAELSLLHERTSPLHVPRIDMYYLRDVRLLKTWGTSRFSNYLRMRRMGRSLRRSLNLSQ